MRHFLFASIISHQLSYAIALSGGADDISDSPVCMGIHDGYSVDYWDGK